MICTFIDEPQYGCLCTTEHSWITIFGTPVVRFCPVTIVTNNINFSRRHCVVKTVEQFYITVNFVMAIISYVKM